MFRGVNNVFITVFFNEGVAGVLRELTAQTDNTKSSTGSETFYKKR